MRIAATEPGTPVGISDAALVQRLRAGETSAGETLAKRYYEPLMRYLTRMVGQPHVAEDLLQQTWLSVLDHLDTFRPEASKGGFKAWVFRIASNKAHDYWRGTKRDRNAREQLTKLPEEEHAPASSRMEAGEREEKLQAALEQLPEAQRQVVLLRYYGEMKFVDIAKTLGCPLNTALGRMHKAMLKLKELMKDD